MKALPDNAAGSAITNETAMGAAGGLATRPRPDPGRRLLARAGALAAGMWIAGAGARMIFAVALRTARARRSPGSASRTTSPARPPG